MLWPTRRQWRSWSIPSKLTAIGALVGLLSLLLTIATLLLQHRASNPQSDLAVPFPPDRTSATDPGAANDPRGSPSSSLSREDPPTFSASAAETPAKLTSADSFSPVTFDEFMTATFSTTLTKRQRQAFLEQHLGKTVVWQGKIERVSTSTEGVSVMLTTGESRRFAFLEFALEYKADLIPLAPGTGLKATCRLRDWGTAAQLDRCRSIQVLSP